MNQSGSDYSAVAILGMGVTGLSVADFLTRRGIDFMFADTRSAPPGLDVVSQRYPDIRTMLGEFDDRAYDILETVVVSPGVSLGEPMLQSARAKDIRLIGDAELFFEQVNAPVIAITGSNGKSTVTTLVGEMARRSGLNTGVGGNLGTPMLDLLSAERRLYVLEMSSFQLELFDSSKGAVSGLLNISPDHLDRYPDIDDYHAAKQRIFKDAACAVVNRQDPLTYPQADDNLSIISFGIDAPNGDNFGLLTENGETWLVGGGEQLMLQSQLAMQGRHNIANALAALALGRSAGLPMAAMLATLQEFNGLPHRCEKIASIDEVLYIDDSKATNVGAACAAIDGFSSATEKNIVLIAGGRTKGQDFSDLVVRAAASVRLCVLIGEAAQELAELLDGQVPTHVCDNLSAAVGVAHAQAHPGDVVLLSPACASFDMFADFADRGRCFRTAVEAINVRLADSEAP
tara:strand:- start:2752 stop:4128 length:1377 start_codon:yes stop_codon:yes gene_type:complete